MWVKVNLLASVPECNSFPATVAAPEPRPFCQDELQLRSGAARDQRPDQGQGVLVEVGLKYCKYLVHVIFTQ